MPTLKCRRYVFKYFPMQRALLVTGKPDLPLQVFECGRLPILIHQPMYVCNGLIRPGWRRRTVANIFFIRKSKCFDVFCVEVFAHMSASIGKQHVIDEGNGRGCPFDVEENSFHRGETNAGPKQTGSNFVSSPLFVYTGVHPTGSWKRRI